MRVDKPWGYELHWAVTNRYVGKVIHVDAGHALSLQYHEVKEETILLWSGRIKLEIERDGQRVTQELTPGQSIHITPGTVHRMTAIEDSDIFEVSTPELQDVVRLEAVWSHQRPVMTSALREVPLERNVVLGQFWRTRRRSSTRGWFGSRCDAVRPVAASTQ